MGLFCYYSQWIRHFAAKVRPLEQNSAFPLTGDALESFNSLKIDVESSVVQVVDETQPIQVGTDASEFALSATLNQRPTSCILFKNLKWIRVEAWISRERSSGHRRSCKEMETLLNGKAFYLDYRSETSCLYV